MANSCSYQADPLSRVTGPRMNPSVDVGCPPRPIRHLRMAERCTPDPSSSRAPVHSALVQKSVTAITNPAGRLSIRMLGETSPRWQEGGRKKMAISLPATLVRGEQPQSVNHEGHEV